MPAWLDNPRAGYVLAAYAVALMLLIGLLVASLWDSRRKQKALRALTLRCNRTDAQG